MPRLRSLIGNLVLSYVGFDGDTSESCLQCTQKNNTFDLTALVLSSAPNQSLYRESYTRLGS